jgi:hypothetical protein
MSQKYPVAYFPPTGTKYKWLPPALTTLGWFCRVKCLTWPQSLTLLVDRGARGYFGTLRFNSINGGETVTRKTRYYKTSLSALLAIEKLGELLLAKEGFEDGVATSCLKRYDTWRGM